MRKKLRYRVVRKDPFVELTKRQILVCLLVLSVFLLLCVTGRSDDIQNALQTLMQTDWLAFLQYGV